MSNSLLITGLGNPGVQYARTRHNIGFMVADRLAERFGSSFKEGFKGLTGELRLGTDKHFLLKPLTYMNLSGLSVSPFMSFYKIEPESLIVIQDDLDIEFGKIKFRMGGSSGGHNGIKSIMEQLGTGEFLRLKIGIGKSKHHNTVGHVLGKFEDEAELEKLIDLGADAAEALLSQGMKKAMNVYNNKSIFDEEN